MSTSAFEILSAIRNPESTHEPVGQLLLGTLVAGVTAFAAVRWLLRYVQTHTFVVFGWYRIVLGAVILGAIVWKNGFRP